MKVKFDSNQPIYLQIMAHIKKQLVNGDLQPGDRIESVRDLALKYGVNPNTMQKALAELERAGYLFSERTSGRCVTADKSLIEELRALEPDIIIKGFVEQMEAIGIKRETIPERLSNYLAKQGGYK